MYPYRRNLAESMSNDTYYCCLICNDRARFVCSQCRCVVYCSKQCQRDGWEYANHAEHCRSLATRVRQPLLAIFEDTTRQETIGRRLTSDRNIFDAIAGYDVLESRPKLDLEQEVSVLRLFYECVKKTKFWEEFSDSTKNFSVFAPTNAAMMRWFELNGIEVHERPSRDSKSDEIDVSETVRAVQRNDRLVSILLGHFLPGIWPISTGLESGPDVPGPTGIPRPRTGLKPLVAALTLRSTYSPIKQMPDRKWFKKRFGKLEVRRTLTIENDRKRVLDPAYAGILVKFEFGELSADIVDNDERPLRPQNGYVYIIDRVLGDLDSPLEQPDTGSIGSKAISP